MEYSGNRVLTCHELKPGEILHSGVTGGKCASFKVITVARFEAVLALGSGKYTARGKDFRNWEWYRAEDCPNCTIARIMGMVQQSRREAESSFKSTDADGMHTGRILAVRFLEARPIPPKTRDWNITAHNEKPGEALR